MRILDAVDAAAVPARLGLILRSACADAAADEIAAKADASYAPQESLDEEYGIVRHRMVALLNVWRRAMSAEAKSRLRCPGSGTRCRWARIA